MNIHCVTTNKCFYNNHICFITKVKILPISIWWSCLGVKVRLQSSFSWVEDGIALSPLQIWEKHKTFSQNGTKIYIHIHIYIYTCLCVCVLNILCLHYYWSIKLTSLTEDLDALADSLRLINGQFSSKESILNCNSSLWRSVIEIFGDTSPSAGLRPMLTELL